LSIQLRDYIVLSALDKTPNLTQAEFGKTLGLDRTTLMTQLDRLERMGLVVRRSAPRDRRIRIPEITEAGDRLRAKVAGACEDAEAAALSGFSPEHVRIFTLPFKHPPRTPTSPSDAVCQIHHPGHLFAERHHTGQQLRLVDGDPTRQQPPAVGVEDPQ
jgi:DNA-binding MarR family transcriptional regulator